MAEYTITTFNADGTSESFKAPCPDVTLKAPQVLVVTSKGAEISGFEAGTEFILIGRTDATDFEQVSSLGNWLVSTPHGLRAKCDIEFMIASGQLKPASRDLSSKEFLLTLRYEGSFEIYESKQLDVRMSRPRNGAFWHLTSLRWGQAFDADKYRHDLAERYGLILEIPA